MLTVEVGGEPLLLLPQKAAFLPRHQALLVADVHIGKATTFRRLGVPVPRGTTEETLAALDASVDATGATHIVILGDLMHSAHSRDAEATLHAVARWRDRRRSLRLTLLRGNHDRRAGDPPAAWRIEVVDEALRLGQFHLRHEPTAVDGDAYTLAGHVHPCISLTGRAHDRLRVACFHFGRRMGLLPAFGAFTGMHPVEPAENDRCYVVVDGRVVQWPVAPAFNRASGASTGEHCPG